MAFTDDVFTDDPETVSAVFTLEDDSTITANAVYRAQSDAASSYGIDVEASKPNLEVTTESIDGLQKGNLVTVGTVEFTVTKISHTGIGLSVVYLKTSS